MSGEDGRKSLLNVILVQEKNRNRLLGENVLQVPEVKSRTVIY